MIGLVNRAIKEAAEGLLGPDRWPRVRDHIDWDVETFVGLDSYDDRITHAMVEATSDMADVPNETILEAAGERFLTVVVPEAFGNLSDSLGTNLSEALENLDSLHTRMSLSLPNVDPPMFDYEQLTDDTHVLTYDSSRLFLVPFVCGVVRALAHHFGLEATIDVAEPTTQDVIRLVIATHTPANLPTHAHEDAP